MIKINSVIEFSDRQVVEEPIYLSRETIRMMERDEEEGLTYIYIDHDPDGEPNVLVRETPEQIMNMPGIINWEQRRYEIAKDILQASNVDVPDSFAKDPYELAEDAIRQADILIRLLKKDHDTTKNS